MPDFINSDFNIAETRQLRLEHAVVRMIFRSTSNPDILNELIRRRWRTIERPQVSLDFFRSCYPEYPVTLTAAWEKYVWAMSAWELLNSKAFLKSPVFQKYRDEARRMNVNIQRTQFGMAFRPRSGMKTLFVVHNRDRDDRLMPSRSCRLSVSYQMGNSTVVASIEPLESLLSDINDDWVNSPSTSTRCSRR